MQPDKSPKGLLSIIIIGKHEYRQSEFPWSKKAFFVEETLL